MTVLQFDRAVVFIRSRAGLRSHRGVFKSLAVESPIVSAILHDIEGSRLDDRVRRLFFVSYGEEDVKAYSIFALVQEEVNARDLSIIIEGLNTHTLYESYNEIVDKFNGYIFRSSLCEYMDPDMDDEEKDERDKSDDEFSDSVQEIEDSDTEEISDRFDGED